MTIKNFFIKNNVKKKLSIFVFCIVSTLVYFPALSQSFVSQNTSRQECFMLLVGKKASADGSVLLAHNNDLSGEEASMVEKFPRIKYPVGDSVEFPSGLKIPQVRETYEWMALKIYKGFAEGDAVAVNEHGLAIAGGVALGRDRNSLAADVDPLIKNGLTGGVRYIALQRSKTARQCVKMLGEMYNRYGVTYPCGIGIADTNEIWYIESGGGFCWAAVRIPDSCYWAQANGYRISHVFHEDTMNFYCSPNLQGFALENGLWNPAEGDFNFARAFGKGRKEINGGRFYDTRRVWRCLDILNPSLKLHPETKDFPQFLKPEKKIDLQTCFRILRDQYEGTAYEKYPEGRDGSDERSIASWNCVHTDVIQLRPSWPVDIGAVMWVGVSAPIITAYVPFYFGIDKIPDFYNVASESFSVGSAFWMFKEIAGVLQNNYNEKIEFVREKINTFENLEIMMFGKVDSTAMKYYKINPSLSTVIISNFTDEMAEKAVENAYEIKLFIEK